MTETIINDNPSFDFSKISVALDLGSSELKGAVCYGDGKDEFSCITTSVIKSSGIQNGCVRNIEQVTGCVKEMIKLLTNTLTNKLKQNNLLPSNKKVVIKKVYVNLSAGRIQSIESRIDRTFGKEITKKYIEGIIEENYCGFSTQYERNIDFDYYKSIPVRYLSDDIDVDTPIGTLGNRFSIVFQNILVPRNHINNITVCLKRADIEEVEFRLTPDALSKTILTPKELDEGVILIDMGAEVTSFAVYRNSSLKYVYNLSKGSKRITEDLQKLQIPAALAEQYKKSLAAFEEAVEPAIWTDTSHGEVKNYDTKTLARIVEWRVEKIFNAINKARNISLSNDIQQIVLTGGGANLKFIKEKATSVIGQNVRLSQFPNLPKSKNVRLLTPVLSIAHDASGHSISMADIITEPQLHADETVSKETVKPKKTTRKKSKFLNNISSTVSSLFDKVVESAFEDNTQRESDKLN